DALDVGAELLKFEFHVFVATVEVVDAVDGGLASGGEAGEDQARRGAQVAGHDRGAHQFADAADHDGGPVAVEVGAHAGQFGHVQESVGEDLFGNDRVAIDEGEQGHDLGLQVGGEAGVGLGDHVDGLEASIAGDAD